MTAKALTAEQELAYHGWWMSDQVPPDTKYMDELGGVEDQCRAAFLEGWLSGEGWTIDGAVTPLTGALAHWVEHVETSTMPETVALKGWLGEALRALKAAEEATS